MPKILEEYKQDIKGKTFGVWGLAFKPETDDIREAPALYMIDEILKEGASVRVFDPEAMKNVEKKYGNKLYYSDHMYDAIKEVDALIICTEWSIFRTPDFNKLKANMKAPVIFDGRNLYDTNDVNVEGFSYTSIGRKITN
jgi:UDPglucose 6-dehydrogenase